MERSVTFRDRQELQSADLQNVQTFGDETHQHMVQDAVTSERQVVGLAVTQQSATEIQVAPGRLWDGTTGKVYRKDQAETISVFSYLAVLDQKWITVSAVGQEQDINVQPRDFLIDLQTGQTQPEAVSMEEARVAVIVLTAGVESATPQKPAAPTGYTLLGYVRVGVSGILEIDLSSVAQLPQLNRVNADVKSLKAWRNLAEPQIATLKSDVAGLALKINGLTSRERIIEISSDIARLKELLNIPDDFASYGADYFLDDDESDDAQAGYNARVDEGVRFPWTAQGVSQLALFNPLTTAVKSFDGFLLPAHTDLVRLQTTTGYAGELPINQYQVTTFNMRQATFTRQRTRFGPTRTICTNSKEWATGKYNPITGVFQNSTGDSFTVAEEDRVRANINHQIVRITQFWTDTYEEPYWYTEATTSTINGSQIAQTILNAQNGWLTKIGMFFVKKGATGIVYVNICETINGVPDLNSCIGSTQVAQSAMTVYPAETVIAFPKPVYLQAGKRYAIVVTTAGAHSVAIVAGSNYTQGTIFYSLDGAYQQGDFTKDMMFKLYYASFTNVRTVVDLSPLSLSGGIADIDVRAPTVVPPSTQLLYEFQRAGVWYPIAAASGAQLRNLPPLLPLRVTFIGSSDLMPGLGLQGSEMKVSRAALALKHFSAVRTLVANTSEVVVKTLLEGFDAAHHTATIKLKIGASEIAASSVTDADDPDGGVLRTATFNLGSPTSSYRVVLIGATDTALDLFHFANRIDIAL
jgi:hypothetical protein